MNYFIKILNSFGYEKLSDFTDSLFPSFKYVSMTIFTFTLSGLSASIFRIFGIDALAFLALALVFIFELATGLARARKAKEQFSSMKFSRFSFKLAYYLIIIAISYLMQRSFENNGNTLASDIFHWMHVFFVVQIVLENIVSISENIAVITGKPKAHWITKLQEKINSYFK